jgi:hypothetical protein
MCVCVYVYIYIYIYIYCKHKRTKRLCQDHNQHFNFTTRPVTLHNYCIHILYFREIASLYITTVCFVYDIILRQCIQTASQGARHLPHCTKGPRFQWELPDHCWRKCSQSWSALQHCDQRNHQFAIAFLIRVWWRSWLRYCATSRKFAGSILDGVGIFHWHNPSGRTVALGLTQILTEMSTRNISWGVKAAGA